MLGVIAMVEMTKKKMFLRIAAIILIYHSVVAVAFKGGMNIGTLLTGAFGIIIIIWPYLSKYIKRYRNFYRLVKSLLILWLASFVIIQSLILFTAFTVYDNEAEYLLVLGAGLHGEELSLTLLERMKKAVEYLEANPQVKVIVSGGQGPGESIPEAEAMARYLIENGIHESRILKESKATSTMENYRYSRQLLDNIEGKKNHKIVVVTSEFHIFRAKMLAARNGFEAGNIPSHTPVYLFPSYCIREYFAIVKSFLFDRL